MTQEELNKLKEITNEEARLEFINDCYHKMLDRLDLEPIIQQISDYCDKHIMEKILWKKPNKR